jgi:Non-histone chromosomal protein MC1
LEFPSKRVWLLKRAELRLKAANRGHTDIKLRERGTKKVHIFTGERKQVKKPKGAPAWMPDKIWKPFVKKVGVEMLAEV